MKLKRILAAVAVSLGMICVKSQSVSAEMMYRLYNPHTSEHFFTVNRMEKSLLTVAGWKYEGVSWKTSSEGNPIYRVYHPQSGEHLYTVNGNEKNLLVAQGWHDKGIFGKSGSKEKSAPIYRLYNPNAPQVSSHHYTMSGGERQYLIKKGWRDEGIAFYQEAFSQSFDQGLPQPLIIDISGYQDPKLINYDALANSIDAAIIRVQHGSIKQNFENESQFNTGEDKYYQTHIAELRKREVPIAVYAFVEAANLAEMKAEETTFYQLAKDYHPSFWWGDFEKMTMKDMRTGAEVFRSQLKSLGAKKVGAYIGHHVYRQMNIDTSRFDAVWIPYYNWNNGLVSGYPTVTNDYTIHQFTSNGHLPGYPKELDFNRLTNPNDFRRLFLS